MKKDWYQTTIKETYKLLNTSSNGLSTLEASKRLKEDGKNILPKGKKKTFLKVFIGEFKSPIVIILLITMVLSFIVKEYVDGTFIFLVVVLDALLGAVQEWKSNKNAEALKNLIKVKAKVIRDGIETEILSEDLVKGDIVLIESGSKVPADLRLTEVQNLSIDESVLTGESIAREKTSETINEEVVINDRSNIAYVGTVVMRGRGIGVVVETGAHTEIGKIAKEVLTKEDTESPLEIRMKKFTKELGILVGVIALIIAVILYYKNYAPREIFFLVVALSVSAIPEGLPVVLTLSLSIASNKMAKENVLVKKLNSVEALGSATVIASDKTGTLTMNEQNAKKIVLPNQKTYEITGNGYNGIGKINASNIEEVLPLIKDGVYNNESHLEKVKKDWISYGDSMDIALLSLAYKANINIEDLKNKVVGRIPYESDAGYSVAFYKEEKQIKVAVKGTLEKILSFSKNMLENGKTKKLDIEKIKEQNEALAKDGYRVLAFASGVYKDFKEKEKYNESDIPPLTFLGLVAFLDPIRPDAKEAVRECVSAGIKVVMITGDHPLTAFSVAKDLEIATNKIEVVTGSTIDNELLKGEKEFDKFISTKKVFSRVTPIQKLKIVESYKRLGEFIAVTGDGVNDAPALKAANVGIVVGSGTDVAKETGSLIITDDKFSTIVTGVEEGRNAYNNVRKVTYMLLSCAVCEVIFYVLSIWLNYEIPLTAIQLLWLNLVTDGIQDVALAFESKEKGIMKEKPRNPKESLFDKMLINEIALLGLIMGIIVFGVWVYLIDYLKFDITKARSYILLLMVFLQNIHCFNCRSEIESIFKKPLKENKMLLYGISAVLILQLIVVENSFLANFLGTTSIKLSHIIMLLLLTLPLIIVSELYKLFERMKRRRQNI